MNFEELKLRAPFGKVKLTIEYDGTNYFGWQRQAPEIPSIQGFMENAVEKLYGQKITIFGAGRTDAGVHALNQIAHFIPTRDPHSYNFVHAFQSLLPTDIVVKKAESVPVNFHAQTSAVDKTYIYKIWNEPIPSAIRSKRSLFIRKPLDIAKLNKAAQYFVGTHDFAALRTLGSAAKTTVRTVNWVKFTKNEDFVEFQINGNGFLKQMVRNIVGTLLQIELNDRHPDSIPELIATRNRQFAGPTVEPQGLYLKEVTYPIELKGTSL
ncbi:MAG: tRNA pseudouridine(38-40) synthase TruA [Oligoflexia bacterium]|nr:tRNA pseudouridine(38-40) synthase TruA [Oligoflexia bacterium]